MWIDQNLSPGVVSEMDNDPARIILNVATTGDTTKLERTLRRVWGGALCVSTAGHTDAELATIQDAVGDTPGMLRSSRNALAGRVDLTLIRATRQLQAHFDATYGQGLVYLAGALAPLD